MEELIKELSKVLQVWFKKEGNLWMEENIYIILLFLFILIFPVFYWAIPKIIKFIKLEILKRDLSSIIGKEEIKEATTYFIQTKFQNISPNEEQEPIYSQDLIAKKPTIPYFLNKAFKTESTMESYYLILGDSGMGKSTLLINLYIQYQKMFWRKRYNMILAPLRQLEIDELWKNINSKERNKTILLLDAFDEDPKAEFNHKDRLEEILLSTRGFQEIIITSRTQFFLNVKEEPSNTNVYKFSLNGQTSHHFKKLYISPFDDQDIDKYLSMKFPFWNPFVYNKRKKAKNVVRLCPNLMIRPMLLSYIDVLIETEVDKTTNILNNSSELYEKLIERWIERESNRISPERKENFKINMYNFSKNLSLYLYNKAGIGGELNRYVAPVKMN